jgi:flagellum-specific ATP synthase
VVLSRELADEGHYPAINIEGSISRAMPNIVSDEHLQAAQQLRKLYSRYQQSRDLISVGAYVSGSDPETDLAIQKMPLIKQFLTQGLREKVSVSDSTLQLHGLIKSPAQSPGTMVPS